MGHLLVLLLPSSHSWCIQSSHPPIHRAAAPILLSTVHRRQWLPAGNLDTTEDEKPVQFPLYQLGQDQAGRWTFALDISGPSKLPFIDFMRAEWGLEARMVDLRKLMSGFTIEACAIAGQAVALSQWHQTHTFCQQCGQPTAPTQAGLRRSCSNKHKQYPRTDPVVIMLVESVDGTKALLGRSHRSPAGMYTMLSGFLDQCESIEEAVRREIYEEARVKVGQVQLLGSQPWPIGRAGSCELMLGCIAKAQDDAMENTGELEDARWFGSEEVASAVRMYEAYSPSTSTSELQQHCMEQFGFFVPPPLAIAHHLCRTWVEHAQVHGPWFKPDSYQERPLGLQSGTARMEQEQQQQDPTLHADNNEYVSAGQVFSKVGSQSRGMSLVRQSLNSAL
ncbi:NUDIX hydrolase domain-like protein [Dunaliella salina]|nr:NUDIX hydrolase domain-like protein [Dunaliella salina]|eukprot:KAF5831681.1 NUDIX hydrolase domain-like protein [Dunaliella salina]